MAECYPHEKLRRQGSECPYCRANELVTELESTRKHLDILADALAEIKATHEGNSNQPIADILDGCVHEIGVLHKNSPHVR